MIARLLLTLSTSTLGVVLTLLYQSPTPAQTLCTSNATPIGALPPAQPIWCLPVGADGPPTSREAANAWLDDFDHALSNAPIGAGYSTFGLNGTRRHQTFRHMQHWMQDVAADALGGVMLRPNRPFRFDANQLVVEFDLAAGIDAYGPADAWGEIDITTAPAPSAKPRDTALYGYDQFPGHYTLGCRLQPDRVITCSLFDDSTRGLIEGGRVWEMSFFQPVGTTNFGGGPFGELGAAFRLCRGAEPDVACRDRFRLVLTATSLTLFVNGVRYFEQTGLPPLPSALLQDDVYVYFAGVQARALSGDRTTRFHWDRVAVNPDLIAPAAPPPAPSNLLGMANGTSLLLAWTNTVAGSAPVGVTLDVTGAYTGSLPLGPTETFAFDGVPDGRYEFRVRATTATGASGPSNSVTLTFPSACTGAPLAPTNFNVTQAGRSLQLRWQTASAGPAPSSFALGVTGAFTGRVPVAGRAVSAVVPPGTYLVGVEAVNACGSSPPTALRRIDVL